MNFSLTNDTIKINQTDAKEAAENPQNDIDNLLYILVPLAVLTTVIFLSFLVYLMATKKRRYPYERQNLIPYYELEDPNDETEYNFLVPGQPVQVQINRNYQTSNGNFELYA